MRVDIGVWTKRKLRIIKKSEENTIQETDDAFESHWLRFEKYMGAK